MQKKIQTCVDIIENSENREETSGESSEDCRMNPESDDTRNLIERYKKLLVLEIGSDEMVESALKNPSGWRGRAERIAQLEERLQRASAPKREPPTLIIDKRRTSELETTLKQMEDSIKRMEDEKLSLKSRIKSLEGSLKEARDDIQILIQREKINSRIPEVLRRFVLHN